MKKIVLSLVLFASVLTACKENKKDKVKVKEAVKVAVNVAELNNVDISASVLNWKGDKPTGSHNGTVALKSGGILVEDGKLTQGEFILDMTSIVNIDMKGSDGAGKIEGHLKSVDFFDVATYPMSKFVITSVEDKGDKVHVTGNLNIKDVTKSITIPATISTENGVTTFTSETFSVDRTDFGITYKSKKIDAAIKDKFINDLMEMSFVVKTKS
ncbi:MAG: YceI family protein [Polaribacter sp.]